MPTKKTTKKAVAKKPVVKQATATNKMSTRGQKLVAKKTTKKVVAKKPVVKNKGLAKKTVKKTTKAAAMKKPTKDLVYASDQESFWVQNGEILNSLIALNDAFAKMDTKIYQFHAHGDKNDFSIWVDSVLCDQECAADLAKAKTPKSARTIVVKHLKLYSI